MFPRLLELPLFGGLAFVPWGIATLVIAAALGGSAIQLSPTRRALSFLLGIASFSVLAGAFATVVENPFGKIPINTYGFLIMLGFLLATGLMVKRGTSLGIDKDFLLDVGIISMIFGLLGAKLNYVLQYSQDFAGSGRSIWNFSDGGFHPAGALIGAVPFLFWWSRTRNEPKVPLFHWKNYVLLAVTLLFAVGGARGVFLAMHGGEYNWQVYKSWQSGFVLYGGVLSAILFACLYVKMRGVPLGRVADLTAPVLMLGVAFGRVGCFLNGCCFGTPCDLPWGVRYPKIPVASEPNIQSPVFSQHLEQYPDQLKLEETHSLAVHPTQLYETIATLAFFFLLSWAGKHSRGRGRVFLGMGMLYAAWRFVLEFLRDDKGRDSGGLFGLTYSQTISVGAFAVCGIWILLSGRSPEPAPAPSTPLQPPPEAAAQDKPR